DPAWGLTPCQSYQKSSCSWLIPSAEAKRSADLDSDCLQYNNCSNVTTIIVLEMLYDHHDSIQSRVEPGRDARKESHQERPGVHHGSRQARARAAQLRGLSAVDKAAAQPCRRTGDAGRCGH